MSSLPAKPDESALIARINKIDAKDLADKVLQTFGGADDTVAQRLANYTDTYLMQRVYEMIRPQVEDAENLLRLAKISGELAHRISKLRSPLDALVDHHFRELIDDKYCGERRAIGPAIVATNLRAISDALEHFGTEIQRGAKESRNPQQHARLHLIDRLALLWINDLKKGLCEKRNGRPRVDSGFLDFVDSVNLELIRRDSDFAIVSGSLTDTSDAKKARRDALAKAVRKSFDEFFRESWQRFVR